MTRFWPAIYIYFPLCVFLSICRVCVCVLLSLSAVCVSILYLYMCLCLLLHMAVVSVFVSVYDVWVVACVFVSWECM